MITQFKRGFQSSTPPPPALSAQAVAELVAHAVTFQLLPAETLFRINRAAYRRNRTLAKP